MRTDRTGWNVLLVLVGVAALVLKPAYHGPLGQVVHDYGGNFAASFAVYFLSTILASRLGVGRLAAVAGAVVVVEAFELTDGFGVMANTYDPFDLLANAIGIVVALGVELATRRPRTHGAPLDDG